MNFDFNLLMKLIDNFFYRFSYRVYSCSSYCRFHYSGCFYHRYYSGEITSWIEV